MTDKEDFPPLLGPGFHVKTMAELRAMCVDAFPLSITRGAIMAGFERFVAMLNAENIRGDIWVNGSFTTQKIDPEDVDVVLRVDVEFYENGTLEQKELMDRIGVEDFKSSHSCHAFIFYEFPAGDSLQGFGEWMRAYWIRQFGFSRGMELKGLAVLTLGP